MDNSALYEMLSQRAPIHTNELTSCVIWDGDFDRKLRPVMEVAGSKVQVRNWIASMIGASARNVEVKAKCENDKCISAAHFIIEPAERANGVEYTQEELDAAVKLDSEGLRQDIIAERLGTSRSRVSRLLKVAKEKANDSSC